MSTVHMYMYRIILHDVIIWVTDAFLNQPPNKGHLFITDKPSCTNVSVIKRYHCTCIWIVAMLVRSKSLKLMNVILSPGLKTLNILGVNLFGFTVI